MTLTIKICCDSAAFEDTNAEVKRILFDLCSRMDMDMSSRFTGGHPINLHDAEGNWCGNARVEVGEALYEDLNISHNNGYDEPRCPSCGRQPWGSFCADGCVEHDMHEHNRRETEAQR